MASCDFMLKLDVVIGVDWGSFVAKLAFQEEALLLFGLIIISSSNSINCTSPIIHCGFLILDFDGSRDVPRPIHIPVSFIIFTDTNYNDFPLSLLLFGVLYKACIAKARTGQQSMTWVLIVRRALYQMVCPPVTRML